MIVITPASCSCFCSQSRQAASGRPKLALSAEGTQAGLLQPLPLPLALAQALLVPQLGTRTTNWFQLWPSGPASGS